MIIAKQWKLKGQKDILLMFIKFKSKLLHRINLVFHQNQFKMNIVILTKIIREDKEGGKEEVNHYFNGGTRFILRGDQFEDAYDDSVNNIEKSFEDYTSNWSG